MNTTESTSPYVAENSTTVSTAQLETSEVTTASKVTTTPISTVVTEGSTSATRAQMETSKVVTTVTTPTIMKEESTTEEIREESTTEETIPTTTSETSESTATTELAAEGSTTTASHITDDHTSTAAVSKSETAEEGGFPLKEQELIVLGAGGLGVLLLLVIIACIMGRRSKPKGAAPVERMSKQRVQGSAETASKSGGSAEKAPVLKASKSSGSAEKAPVLKDSKSSGSAEKAPALKGSKEKK